MAHVAKLPQPEGGMNEFLAVSGKVGGDRDCPNKYSDVQAVQRLLALIVRGTSGEDLGVPPATGRFDALTGFHIFNIQNWVRKSRQGTIVDGCVSPARGVSYGGGGIYSILHLNAMARANNRALWEKLLDDFRLHNPTGVL